MVRAKGRTLSRRSNYTAGTYLRTIVGCVKWVTRLGSHAPFWSHPTHGGNVGAAARRGQTYPAESVMD